MVPSLGISMKFKQRRIVLFPDPLAPLHLEVDALDYVQVAKALVQVADADDGIAHRISLDISRAPRGAVRDEPTGSYPDRSARSTPARRPSRSPAADSRSSS